MAELLFHSYPLTDEERESVRSPPHPVRRNSVFLHCVFAAALPPRIGAVATKQQQIHFGYILLSLQSRSDRDGSGKLSIRFNPSTHVFSHYLIKKRVIASRDEGDGITFFEYPLGVAFFVGVVAARAVIRYTPREIGFPNSEFRGDAYTWAISQGSVELLNLFEEHYGADIFEEVGRTRLSHLRDLSSTCRFLYCSTSVHLAAPTKKNRLHVHNASSVNMNTLVMAG